MGIPIESKVTEKTNNLQAIKSISPYDDSVQVLDELNGTSNDKTMVDDALSHEQKEISNNEKEEEEAKTEIIAISTETENTNNLQTTKSFHDAIHVPNDQNETFYDEEEEEKANSQIRKTQNTSDSQSLLNAIKFRQKFQSETELEYKKAKEIHDGVDFYLEYKLNKSDNINYKLNIFFGIFSMSFFYYDFVFDIENIVYFWKQTHYLYFFLTLVFIFIPYLYQIFRLRRFIIPVDKFRLNKYIIYIFYFFIYIYLLIFFPLATFIIMIFNYLNSHNVNVNDKETVRIKLKEYIENLRFFKLYNHYDLMFEKIPQLFLQIYIIIEKGLNKKEKMTVTKSEIFKLFFNLIWFCFSLMWFTKCFYNGYTRHLLPELPVKLGKKFIVLRFLTNLLFFISILFVFINIFLLNPFNSYGWINSGLILFILILLIIIYKINVFDKNCDCLFDYIDKKKPLQIWFHLLSFINMLICFGPAIDNIRTLSNEQKKKNFFSDNFLYIWYGIIFLLITIQSLIFCFFCHIDFFVIHFKFSNEIKEYDLKGYFTDFWFRLVVCALVICSFLIGVVLEIFVIKPYFKYQYYFYYLYFPTINFKNLKIVKILFMID